MASTAKVIKAVVKNIPKVYFKAKENSSSAVEKWYS